jgi:wobble nucleotide-excising tRNase
MSPWLPMELVQTNSACISMNEVLTIIEPRTALIEYYNNAVVEANEMISNFTDQIDESLLDDFDSDEELDLEDGSEELLQEPSTNKQTIH